MESLQEQYWEPRAGENAEETREFEAAAPEPPPRFVDYGRDI
jgi:hypothetical protein